MSPDSWHGLYPSGCIPWFKGKTNCITFKGPLLQACNKREEWEFSLLFFKIFKKVPWFWKKIGPTIFIYWSNVSFKNAILSVSRKKNLRNVSLGGSSFRVLQIKCLSKCLYYKKPPLPWTFQVARLYYIVSKISFKKIEFHTKIRCNQIHIDELRLSIFHRVSTWWINNFEVLVSKAVWFIRWCREKTSQRRLF